MFDHAYVKQLGLAYLALQGGARTSELDAAELFLALSSAKDAAERFLAPSSSGQVEGGHELDAIVQSSCAARAIKLHILSYGTMNHCVRLVNPFSLTPLARPRLASPHPYYLPLERAMAPGRAAGLERAARPQAVVTLMITYDYDHYHYCYHYYHYYYQYYHYDYDNYHQDYICIERHLYRYDIDKHNICWVIDRSSAAGRSGLGIFLFSQGRRGREGCSSGRGCKDVDCTCLHDEL